MKFNNMKSQLMMLILFISNRVSTVSADDPDSGLSESQLLIELETITLVLFAIILLLNFMNYRKLGNSIISLPFIYILGGLVFTIFARLFLLFNYFHWYEAPGMVIGIYWHFFIYLSIIYFFIAIKKVNDRTKDKKLTTISKADYIFFIVTFTLAGILYLTPENLGMDFMQAMMVTIIPEWGLLHFMAFVLTAILTIALIIVINNTKQTPAGSYLNKVSVPFTLFLVITSLNHLSGLLTGPWRIISVDPVIQVRLEQSFWTIGFFILTIGYLILYREISQSSSFTSVEIGDTSNEDSKMVMKILREHVGSLALKVSLESMEESGIKLSEINEKNIDKFAEAVEKNTQELLGAFPSRYLKVSLQRAIADK